MRICGFYWKTGIPSGNHSNLFVPDEKKDGGAYRTISGHIKRVDEESHCLILEEGKEFCWKIFLISHSLLMKSKERRYKNVIKLITKYLR